MECSSCHKDSPIEKFYPRDKSGKRNGTCASCRMAAVRRWVAKNIDYVRAYRKQWNQKYYAKNLEECRVRMRKNYAKNRDLRRAQSRAYYYKHHKELLAKRQTDEFRKRRAKRNAQWAARYPEKALAQSRLHEATATGRVIRMPCEVCGAKKGIHAHHEDYSKPLDVKWLCPLHHVARHRVLRESSIS